MSKARGPLKSVNASGTLGKAMIFQNWKGIPRVKKYRKPTQPNTASQLDKRNLIRIAVSRWQTLTTFLKSLWQTTIGKIGKTMSGYNYFLSEYIKSMVAGETPSDFPRQELIPGYPIMNGLVSWWNLNEGTGSIAHDIISEYTGNITSPQWVPGKKSTALYFDETPRFVTIDGLTNVDMSKALTIEFWVKIQPNDAYRPLVAKYNNNTDEEWITLLYADNRVMFGISDTAGAGSSTDILSTTHLTPGQWYHIVATWDNTTMTLYVDTIPEASTVPVNKLRLGSNPVWLGKYLSEDAPFYFLGTLDEVRIYNRALSKQEIEHNYNL